MRQLLLAPFFVVWASTAVAQSRTTMGVAVTVVPAALTATITRSPATYAWRGAGTVEMSARLALVSRSAYTLTVRADSALAGAGSPVLVRAPDGRFERVPYGASRLLARSTASSDARQLDLVVRVAGGSGRAALTAELVAERLDQ